jgi:hypothetical protein
VINRLFGFQHDFLYDETTLSKALCGVGFEQIVRVTPGSSDYDPLNGIDKRTDHYTAFETLVMEAKK